MLQEGRKYRFEPPMRTVGFQGEGNATRRFPNLNFTTGICMRIGTHTIEFRGEVDSKTYKFFAKREPEQGGSKVIPI
jgi:hypothetical protein